MIAKDEERRIGACIASVRHIVEEIVLVDTGSLDRTREVAAGYGALVLECPWTDDFSVPRNAGLAAANGDWVLVLDADEVLDPVDPNYLEILLSASHVEGYFVNIHSHVGTGCETLFDEAVRLFRHRPQYRFEGRIHEQVVNSIRRQSGPGCLARSDLTVKHFGYLADEVESKAKRERNIRIIERALASDERDPFLHFCLGVEHIQMGDVDAAVTDARKALTLMRGTEGYFKDALLLLCTGLLRSARSHELASVAARALEIAPDDPDFLLILGIACSLSGRHSEAIQHVTKALTHGCSLVAGPAARLIIARQLGAVRQWVDAVAEALRAVVCAAESASVSPRDLLATCRECRKTADLYARQHPPGSRTRAVADYVSISARQMVACARAAALGVEYPEHPWNRKVAGVARAALGALAAAQTRELEFARTPPVEG
jgi:hypothetical protein